MISDDLVKRINWQINLNIIGKPEKLYEASQYLIKQGGKRIRPLLCLLSCKSAGGEIDKALNTAVAIELIHTFTLIHDDIMDKDDLRRGVPSVHRVYGESTSILAGDLLFAKAFEICDPRVKGILSKATVEICEGQEMDLSFELRDDVNVDEYLEMIRKKTASLFEASTKSGAVIANADKKTIEDFANYGRNLGMAFQIYDDVLDIIGEEEKFGKPIGSDIERGKKSIVILKALEKLPEKERENLKIFLRKENSKSEIQKAIALIKSSNAIEDCKAKAKFYIDEAKKSLINIPGSDEKKSLIEIADFVIKREK
ncbi:MAG: polyprenyl synthetase family protein [Candidatus Altiarchaeota archaeon]